jgi:hypothetical protein
MRSPRAVFSPLESAYATTRSRSGGEEARGKTLFSCRRRGTQSSQAASERAAIFDDDLAAVGSIHTLPNNRVGLGASAKAAVADLRIGCPPARLEMAACSARGPIHRCPRCEFVAAKQATGTPAILIAAGGSAAAEAGRTVATTSAGVG